MQESYIKKTSHFICVSGYVSSFIPKSKSRYVIHNGVDEIEFIPGKNSDFKSLDKIKKPKILFCGRLLYMKGVDSLISSANEIGDKAHFIFAGSGNIKRLSSRLKNKDNVTFIGGVDHAKIHLLYQKCDIFVLPSFSESFPISLLEAMSSGLPVIATEVGGIPEMIIDSKIGCLIKARDQDALEDSILRLISSKAQRTRLGKAARELVLSRFTQSEMASKTAGIYEKIVSDEIMRKKNG
jgi:glycosyltransferase involved in cell wall biosynthesis